MSKLFGCQNMVSPIKKVLIKKPDKYFGEADIKLWHYTDKPDLTNAVDEHNNLADILKRNGAEVIYHSDDLENLADSIYVFDPALITDHGAIILRMGKKLRQGEEEAMEKRLMELGVPILHKLTGNSLAEGGDILWVDEKNLAVGIGFRTNFEGYTEIKTALDKYGINVFPVHLPYYTGPEACLHLLSMISIVKEKLAVIYPPLMPVLFYQFLLEKGFEFVEVPDKEFLTMGPNVLALSPGHCLMIEGNPITKKRLEDAGCIVETYKGDDISLKSEGGPTCLTRPLLREY